jgi:hypothetical protein
VERLKTATAAGATNESTKRFCIIDSGAGTSTGPAPPGTGKGWRPATIEYCTDVVWLDKDEGLRVQAARTGQSSPGSHTGQMDRCVACARRQGRMHVCQGQPCARAPLLDAGDGRPWYRTQRVQPRLPRQLPEQREASHSGYDHQHSSSPRREILGSTNHQH